MNIKRSPVSSIFKFYGACTERLLYNYNMKRLLVMPFTYSPPFNSFPMFSHDGKKLVFAFFFFFLLITDFAVAEVKNHFIEIEIDPERHFLSAADVIYLGERHKPVFYLSKDMRIVSVQSKGESIKFNSSINGDFQKIELDTPGLEEITLQYEGIIYDEIKKPKDITFVRGDRTRGIVSEKGVFLSPESGWYPDDGGLSIYNLRIKITGGLKVVTQGEMINRRYDGDVEYSEWKGTVPVDTLFLIASRFEIDTVEKEGIRYSTYLSRENAHLSKVFIDGSRHYIEFYSKILGRYPYRDWAIVENFFSSGYGMPGFTLLDPLVIKQGERILRPGYIDHEIVHSWFGNYVYPDYRTGNWVEALTTYLTNYYYKEVFSGVDEARRYRISTIDRYSIRVSPDKDYPLKRFVSKEEDFENDIGYGKGSMVFHALRRIVGDKAFFDSIRDVVERFGRKRASWDDLRQIFEKRSKKDLKGFFNQWIERRGGPRLRLSDVSLKMDGDGYRVSGRIYQEGDIYQIMIPVVVFTEKGRKETIIDLKDRAVSFDIPVDDKPKSVEIDPDYHTFRIIPEEDLNPSLKLFLSRKKRFFILTDDRFTKAFQDITERLIREGGEIIHTLDEYEGKGSIFVVGRPIHPLIQKLLEIKEGTFRFRGKEFKGQGYSILLSVRSPYDNKEVIVYYYGNSSTALERARYIPYYGTDTYVVFKDGQPVERGYLERFLLSTRYTFLSKQL